MIEGKNSHFDPFLTDVFATIEGDFRKIFDDNMDMPHKSTPPP
jgi:hypothetical protein